MNQQNDIEANDPPGSSEDQSCGSLCMRRRDVLIAGAVGGAAAALGPQLAMADSTSNTGQRIASYPRLKVASLADLVEGEGLAFNYPLNEQPNMLVKLGREAQNGIGPDKDIVAFSVLCPHMGGSLRGRYEHEHGSMGPCPFHFSTFDLTRGGVPVHASATQNLPQITLETDGKDVFATGITGLVYGFRDNLADGTLPDGSQIIGIKSIPGETQRG